MSDHSSQFQRLIETVSGHPDADFYRLKWGNERAFDSLPTVSREDFLQVPLSRRRYKVEKAQVKIVHDGDRMFLSEWAFSDIGKEHYGIASPRPLVYMLNSGEAVEKAMWCYGNGVVPLAAEKDADIAMYAAGKYRVTSMLTDPDALPKFAPYFETHEPLESITIIGTDFPLDALMPFEKHAKEMRLVLALPETGAFASASLSITPEFTALPGCLIEHEETLVVSKVAPLVTPIIRYRTAIPSSLYGGA